MADIRKAQAEFAEHDRKLQAGIEAMAEVHQQEQRGHVASGAVEAPAALSKTATQGTRQARLLRHA
jgi:hypothetical protein